jgi:macrolide transport system ATP-binding/permease protein
MSAWRRFGNLFRRTLVDGEIEAELKAHVEMRIEDNLAAGMSAGDARRDALVRFGNRAATREQVVGEDAALLLASIWADVRFACRQLMKSPGFAGTAIVVLALGIGASVALFAFVDAALIKPLPYQDPARLADVTETLKEWPRSNLSYLDYRDWKRMNTVFSSLEIYRGVGRMLGEGDATVVRGAVVSAGFFKTLGVQPVLGHDFSAGADRPEAPKTVLLSYGAWQARFGGSADVVGRVIKLDDEPVTVIGVLPKTFQFALSRGAEFWAPLQVMAPGPNTPMCYTDRGSHCLYGVGRLKDGVSVAQAQAEMKAIAANLERQYPETNRGQGASVMPLSQAIVGKVRAILLALLGGAGLLLAIACVNVSSLLLVRSENRRREVALRSALGASRGRLLRQFVTESVLLVVLGGVLGVAWADGALQVLYRLIPKDMLTSMPYLEGLRLNAHVLGFAAAVCVFAAVLFSLAPLLRVGVGFDVRAGLADAGRGSSGTIWRRFGANLVTVELAIALVLLVGAGLFGKSFYKLQHVELGFQPEHLAAMDVTLPGRQYGKDELQRAAAREMVRRLASLPGVTGAGTTNDLPLSGNGDTRWVRFVGLPYNGEHNEVNERQVSAGYMRTVGVKLIRGRFFDEEDDNTKPRVVIVNQAFVRKYFGDEDPIGKRFGNFRLDPNTIWTVVGVVGDLREGGLNEEVWPAFYEAFNQNPDTDMQVVARTSGDAAALLPAMVKTVHGLDPGIATLNEITMEDKVDDSPAAYLQRSVAWLVGGFAGLALVLSVVGLYGVIAYSVSQRTREIGVRMALGAARSSVARLILKDAGRLIAIGLAAGLVCSVGAAMLVRSMLFGTQAWDVGTLVSVAVVLGGAAMLASWLPAHRAASVNPVDALRAE